MSLHARLLLGVGARDEPMIRAAFHRLLDANGELGWLDVARDVAEHLEPESHEAVRGLAGFDVDVNLWFSVDTSEARRSRLAIAEGVVAIATRSKADVCLVYHDEEIAFVRAGGRSRVARWAIDEMPGVWDAVAPFSLEERIPPAGESA